MNDTTDAKHGAGDGEFFIGWQGKAPPRTGAFLKRRTLVLLAAALVLAAGVAALQRTIGRARFDFGNIQSFSGILLKEPAPLLVTSDAVYFLVEPNKFGFDAELASKHHLQQVTLDGTLIERDDGESMIEARPDTIIGGDHAGPENPLGATASLGEMTLQGEIVDSKCYLGVMNPGEWKPHRACAIHCIRGGIPPLLLVRSETGNRHFLLVDENGAPVNDRILDHVAVPIEITGAVERAGPLHILKANPSQYRPNR